MRMAISPLAKGWVRAVCLCILRVCRMGRGSAQEKEYQADLAYARRIRDGLVSEAHNLATKCLAKGELEEALELTTRAVDMAPGHAESQESLAYLQRLKRQADGATAAKEELLETGKAHLTDQRYADAARSFGAALKLDPSDEVRRTNPCRQSILCSPLSPFASARRWSTARWNMP